MNANEMADLMIQFDSGRIWEHAEEIANMLRQQAKELDEAGHMIGVLREYISDLENGLDSSIKLNKAQAERNNEPVAWMSQGGDVSRSADYFEEMGFTDLIPLYTHPVKELKNIVVASATCSCGKVMEVTNLQPVKELTDEEITEIFDTTFEVRDYEDSFIKFARAILRKAQEK